MKIRAITVFVDVGPPLDEVQIARLGKFTRAASHAFESDGVAVQTTRLATRIFPSLQHSYRPPDDGHHRRRRYSGCRPRHTSNSDG